MEAIMEAEVSLSPAQGDFLKRLFVEHASEAPIETLVLRARERTSSMKQLQVWLRSYQRSLDLSLHELVQANYGAVLALHARNLSLRQSLQDLRPQLSALKLDVSAAARAISDEQRALQLRVERARALAQRQRVLQRALATSRALAKLESLLAALPRDAGAAQTSHELERVARALGQVQFTASEGAAQSALVQQLQPRLEEHATALSARLDALLRSALFGTFHSLSHSHSPSPSHSLILDESLLSALLRAYASLRQTEQCAHLVSDVVCAGPVRLAISKANLLAIQVHSGPGEPSSSSSSPPLALPSLCPLLLRYESDEVRSSALPLQLLCDELIALAERSLLPLARLAANAAPEQSFALLARSWWPLVDESCQRQLASVFVPSPMRPQLFHAHYSLAHDMLARLEALAPTRAELEALREASAAKSFRRRWNTAAYFMIRYRELVARLDATLSSVTLLDRSPSGHACALAASCAVLAVADELWSPTWHLDALSYRALKFTLELALRLVHWFDVHLESLLSAPLTHASTLVLTLSELSVFASALESRVSLALRASVPSVPSELVTSACSQVSLTCAHRSERVRVRVREALVRALSESCGTHVAEVRGVASAYRLTGQRVDALTPASPYARSLFASLSQFSREHSASLKALDSLEWTTRWLRAIVTPVLARLAEQALALLASERQKDALISKVNKGQRGGGGGGVVEVGLSDADKMTLQLRIDADALLVELRALGVHEEALLALTELRSALTAALKD